MITTDSKTKLEHYFQQFRQNIIGIDQEFETPFGKKKIVYTDWTASGRLYRPIEEKLMNDFGPFVANTHTETTVSGTAMTMAYHEAKQIIKRHVNANENDVLINTGTGMTGVVNKFQRILGLKIPENLKEFIAIPKELKPIVFISHMEHHSNQTSWLETIADVVVLTANEEGLFCLEELKKLLYKYQDRSFKIASITSCSNVTGIRTPYHKVAKLMHQNNGVCFVDFACSGPYVKIDMHPDEESYLDAIFFSPHKFLGGPGTSGVLIFNKNLYNNNVPDCPGGGTVSWTNPWGEHKYIDNIEDREDGGTPGFLQVIKTALAIQLKEQMGIENILKRVKVINEQHSNDFVVIGSTVKIEMDDEKIVNCFDENDLPLGNMTLRDSKLAAESAKKDVVLRNAKTDPPVVKIMNYKKELLKRLFKKLGKEMESKDLKSK
jgi:selenocysteine lyase/cysteine desulfurase